MAIVSSDLLLVQRGSTPQKAEAGTLATYIKGEVEATDIGIASASNLGVIRVGTNLSIDGSGILSAVIPAGLEYQGVWLDPNSVPASLQNGYFWIWDGGNGVALNNVGWGSSNGTVMNDGDKIFYDGSQFDVVPVADSGVVDLSGNAPIVVNNADPAHPEISVNTVTTTDDGVMTSADKVKLDSIDAGAQVNVNQNLTYAIGASDGVVEISDGTNATIPAATQAAAGLMTSADKTALDNIAATPGGVLSIGEGTGISIDNSLPATPVVSVEFGAAPNGTPVTVMPYDISTLAELN